jgi:MbtH protein
MEDNEEYSVVVNDEEQFSLWQRSRALPAGWRLEGFSGSRENCLVHINRIWTDMRPLSLRQTV